MISCNGAPLNTSYLRALLAAFKTDAVSDKLKERTENRTYHAIPEDGATGDANRLMAFLEMVTGWEAELFSKESDTTVEALRDWVNPVRWWDKSTSGQGMIQLYYNPTFLLDKSDRLRVIRPEEQEPARPCPFTFEEYSQTELKALLESSTTHDAPPQKTQSPFARLPENLTMIDQRFRLLDPANDVHSSWEVMYGECMNLTRYICLEEPEENGCDETIVDTQLLENTKWIVRLKEGIPDSRLKDGILGLSEDFVALL